jgi:chromosome partitioning protein
LKEYSTFFDYIFIDFPPSSSRLTEVLLELSDAIMIVVQLDSLGLGGFVNTIQYFIDNDLDLDSIKYIVPNGYSKNRRAPKISLDKLQQQAAEFIPDAKVLPALQEKSIIKNLQAEGLSPFDVVDLPPYDRTNRDLLLTELKDLFSQIDV